MAAAASEAQQAEQAALLERMDTHSVHKTFRSANWRPNQRRNKNIKTILGDASRREAASASAVATPQNNSGAATPVRPSGGAVASAPGGGDDGLSTSGTSTPAGGGGGGVGPGGAAAASSLPPNLAQANRSLSKLVLEKSLTVPGRGAANGGGGGAGGVGIPQALPTTGGPTATYTNIESAPSLAHSKHYCDVTGLAAPYTDPKTRMRYHNREVFALIRSLPQGAAEQYLEARGAHTVLK